MTPMGRIQLLILFVLLGAVSACNSTGQTGLFPAPVWLPEIQDVKVPSGSFTDGDTAEFEVEWTGGRDPFKVHWDFGGGGSPDEIESDSGTQTHRISTRFVNETTQDVTYTGTVTVVDWSENQTSHHFTFTVSPAPSPEAPAAEGEGGPGDGDDPPLDGEEPPVDDGGEPPIDDGGGTPPDDGTEPPPDGEETPPDDGDDPPPVEDDPPVEEDPPVDDDPPVEVDPPPPLL